MDRGYSKFLAAAIAMAVVTLGAANVALGQSYLAAPVPEPTYAQPSLVQPASATTATYSFDDLANRIAVLEASMTEEKKDDDDGWLDTSAQPFTVNVGGRIIWHYFNFAGQSPGNMTQYGDLEDYNEFRHIRFHFSGKGYGVLFYKLEFEPETEESATNYAIALQDAFVGMTDLPVLKTLTLGQKKTTGGLEWITSLRFTKFIERAQASNFFAPGYRLGLHQSGQYADDALLLQSAVLFGNDNAKNKEYVGDDQGIRIITRAVWTPIYEDNGRALVHIGGGWEYMKADQSVTIRPDVHESATFIGLGALGCDHYNTGRLEFAVNSGPLSVQSELFMGNYADTTHYGSPNAYGAYIMGGWFLTGEHRSYSRANGAFGRVKPNTNFWLVDTCGGCDAGWGAWEAAARWDYIDFTQFIAANGDPGDTAGTLHNLTLGLNWYWNPHTRMCFNYIHSAPNTFYQAGGYQNTSEADILGMRIQMDF